MDTGTRRLLLIAGGLAATLLVVVGAWTMIGRHSGTVPVLQADDHPIRVKPENAGGMQVAGANEDVLSGGDGTTGGKLAPAAEAPAPQALRAPPPPAPVATAPTAPPPAVAATPMPTPVAPFVQPAPAKPATPPAKAAVASAKPAAMAPDKAVPAAHPTPAGKVTLVQLAAVSSEDAAKSEWQRLAKRMPDILGHHEPTFSKIEHDGHVFWRLRTGGFSDTAQATQFCEKVRAKGSSCSVADF
jgi:hypothetical protein